MKKQLLLILSILLFVCNLRAQDVWTTQTSGLAGNIALNDILYVNSTYITVGSSGTILTSTDGVSWTARTSGVSTALNSIAFGNGMYVIAGSSNVILTSTNLSTWTTRASGHSVTTISLSVVEYLNGNFVMTGSAGTILTSTDGISWTIRHQASSLTTQALRGSAFNSGQYVVVGGAGVIYTSADLATWTSQTSNTTSNLFPAIYAQNKYVTAGQSNGPILNSTNGTTWTTNTPPIANAIFGLVSTGSKFVSVGQTGNIMTSPDGAIWTQVTGVTQTITLNSVAFSGTQFVAVGNSAQISTSSIVPTITTVGSLLAFSTVAGTASATQTFTVSANGLSTNLSIAAPTGFEVSTSAGSGYNTSLNLTQSGGTVPSTTIYTRLAAATTVGSYSGNIVCSSTGATSQNVAIPNSTVNAPLFTTWNGSTWSNGTPTSTVDAIIASNTAPASFTCKDLTINSTFALNTSGITATVNGNITNSGTGIAGTGGLTIAANSSISGTVINFNGVLTVNSAATLTTAGLLTLTSDATNTAIVANSAGSISGNVTVQRFIPSGRRVYRFLAHPFTANLAMSSLTDNIDITGFGGAPFTTTTTNNPSAFSYNNATANVTITPNDPGWNALTASSTLNAKTGYRILVRGSKGQASSLTGGAYTPAAVTLNWTGTLNQGNQVFTLSRANANAQYNLIGNPYASPVNLSLTIRGSNINANFTVWNAQAGSRGAYFTQTFSTSYILPSGATFFAQTANGASNNTITFEEADKATGTPTSIFRTSIIEDQLVLELKDSNNNYADQLAFFFDDKNKNYTSNNDVLWDAEKLTNPDANLYSFSNDGKKLAIDRRPLADNTIIPLGLTNTANAYFTITVKELPQINSSYNLYLNDKLLNTLTLLQANTSINIEVTSNTQSQGNNRLEIVSKLKPVLPIVSNTFNIKLSPNPTKNMVTISFSNVEQANTTITLTNAAGKAVKTIQAGIVQTGVQRVNVKDLAIGVYYVILNNGTDRKTEKLVIQ